MKAPSIPDNELKRQAALESLNILDTDAEERFDRLTSLAANIFQVPIALVSLLDKDRQWFKSCQGLSERQTPRNISFCGHAILGDDIFVIEDTLEDVRFVDNPLVTGEQAIRFYAGFPIRHPDGSKLGALCIKDTQPRVFSKKERQILIDLAKIAEHEIFVTELATMDELTNIYNRRGFATAGKRLLNLCQRRSLTAALIFIDLNGFKKINDDYGHAEGDNALIAFANMLDECCRESDLVARMGGDEFILLLADIIPTAVEQFMQRFKRMVSYSNIQRELNYELSYSSGIVFTDSEYNASLEELIAKGDELMYQRKKG